MPARNRKNKEARPIFDAIRKPVAPHSRLMEAPKNEEKVHPAGRKAKYRPKDDEQDQ